MQEPEVDFDPVPAELPTSGDALDLIKQLAYERFIETGAGSEEDFENLWRLAFQLDIEMKGSKK